MNIDLFELGTEEQKNKPSETKNVSPKQCKDAFNRLYIRKGVLTVPFKVNFCIAVARQVMLAQKVAFIPMSVVLAVASEFNLDLSMQGRKAQAQIKVQCASKGLNIGTFEEVEISRGKGKTRKVTQLLALKVNKTVGTKLDTCTYSALT